MAAEKLGLLVPVQAVEMLRWVQDLQAAGACMLSVTGSLQETHTSDVHKHCPATSSTHAVRQGKRCLMQLPAPT